MEFLKGIFVMIHAEAGRDEVPLKLRFASFLSFTWHPCWYQKRCFALLAVSRGFMFSIIMNSLQTKNSRKSRKTREKAAKPAKKAAKSAKMRIRDHENYQSSSDIVDLSIKWSIKSRTYHKREPTSYGPVLHREVKLVNNASWTVQSC